MQFELLKNNANTSASSMGQSNLFHNVEKVLLACEEVFSGCEGLVRKERCLQNGFRINLSSDSLGASLRASQPARLLARRQRFFSL